MKSEIEVLEISDPSRQTSTLRARTLFQCGLGDRGGNRRTAAGQAHAFENFPSIDGRMDRGEDSHFKQDLDLFRMPVEMVVQTDDEPEYKRVDVVGPHSDFNVNVARKPKPGGIIIDPRKKILRMSQDIRVAVFTNRGEESASELRYNDAVDAYQQALEIDGNSSLASFRMAEARFESGDINTAVQLFRDSLNGDLTPKWLEVWAHINIGKIYDLRGGQRDRAVQEYQKAVNTGDDSYGAQAAAKEYLMTPFRQAPAN